MATSGSFTGSTSNEYITPKIEWSCVQSLDGNYSTVTATLYYKKSSSSTAATSGTLKCSITINGNKSSETVSSFNIPTNNAYQNAMTHTVKVPHNSDGTKSITISCTGYISGTTLESTTCKSTVTLTTIPRASSISATSANVGSAITIAIKRASSSFTHTLSYVFGNLSGTIATNTEEVTIKWTTPTTFYSQMASAKSMKGTITCITYSGSDQIGTSTCEFTVTVSDENAPVLNPKVYVSEDSDTYKLTGSTTKLIRYYTWATYEINASAQNGATIVSQSMSNGDIVYTDDTAKMQQSIVSDTFVFSATDSRGYTTRQELIADVVDYIKPTVIIGSPSFTSDGSISFTIKGAYFNGSFGVASNTLAVKYRYKTSSGSYSSWQTATATISGNTYTAKVSLTDLDYLSNYIVQAQVTDKLSAITSNELTFVCIPLFDWGKTNFNFNVPVVAPSLNGMYVKKVWVNGTDSFQIQTRFSDLSGNGNSRHTFHIFGSANYQPIQGVLTVGNAGRFVWEGTSGVSAAAVDASNSGVVEITLPATAYDIFAIISVYEFDATA